MVRGIRWIATLLSCVAAVGCAQWTEIHYEPWQIEGPVPFRAESSASLIVEEVRLTVNGGPTQAAPAFQDRFVRTMGRAGLFGSVYGPSSVESAPAGSARAKLRVVEDVEHPQLGVAMAKGALVGLSLFTLAPLLPLRVDKTGSMHLEVDLPNGQQRMFEVGTSASAVVELYGDMRKAGADLDELVTHTNLEALVARLVRDSAIRAYLYGDEAG